MVDWDQRYRERHSCSIRGPHGLLVRFAQHIPNGLVVDIASGSGRDLLFLAERGFSAVGLERSGEAIRLAREAAQQAPSLLTLIQADASELPLKQGSAEGVIIFYFLLRGIASEVIGLLRKGGILICETFLKRQNQIDRWRNPDHLLDDGELFHLFGELEPIFYEEGIKTEEGRAKATAQYVGRKG